MAESNVPRPTNIFFADGLAGDVLEIAKSLPNDTVRFYTTSNNPTNQPTSWGYGGYIFYKTNGRTKVFYLGPEGVANSNSIISTTTEITWIKSYAPVIETKTVTTDNNGYAVLGLPWTTYIMSCVISSPDPGQNRIKVNLFGLNNYWYGEFKDALSNNAVSNTEITIKIMHI